MSDSKKEKGMKQSTQIYILLALIVALFIMDRVLLMYSNSYATWQLGQLKSSAFKLNGNEPPPDVP